MNSQLIYTELLREAKRRTRRKSPERERLVEMDQRTRPSRPAVQGSISELPPTA